jgi:hypothetical protein
MRVQALPDNWKTASALNGFAQCLGRLSTRKVLEEIADTMVVAQRRFDDQEERKSKCGRGYQVQVLRFGIQTARLDDSCLTAGGDNCACV